MARVTLICEGCGVPVVKLDDLSGDEDKSHIYGQDATRAMMDHMTRCPHYEVKAMRAREDASRISRAMMRAD